MKTKLLNLLFIFFLLFSGNIQAKKVLLRFNLQKGTIYSMTMDMTNTVDQSLMGQNVKIDQKMKMVLDWKVLDVLPNKNYLAEYSFGKISMEINANGQNVNFDSENPTENNPILAPLNEMKKVKLQIEFTNLGKVVKVTGMEDLISKISGNQTLSQSFQMFSSESNFESFFSQTFNYFPEKEVEKGDKWTSSMKLSTIMNMETKMDFEVADITNDHVILNVNSVVNIDTPIEQQGMKIQLKMDGTQKGTMNINLKDGWLDESNLIQNFTMNMKMKNPQSGEDLEIPIKMKSAVKISVERK